VLLYQLFYNLLNNSLKFARKDTPPVISITASPMPEASAKSQTPQLSGPRVGDTSQVGNEWVKITVADNGIGFEQAYANRIFDSFTRLHSKDTLEGTGLGLALCKKIVERHGGNISAIGAPDAGASINILLPLRQVQ